MDRELRLKLITIVCAILMFVGLALFYGVSPKIAFIDQAYLPFSYAIIAISGFAVIVSVFIAERVMPIMLASFLMGLGMIIFALTKLVPH